MVNTLTNQLIDSGTINNLQGGFIARGLRMNEKKTLGFTPGEWKWVNNPGDDLRKNVFPLPTKEPSGVLYQLLGTLVQSGKELASVAEIFTGKMPGQNTPAATTMATIEQGLKVFTSIYKRIYRGMQEEYEMIFDLNKRYMPNQTVQFVAQLNGETKNYAVSKFDYQKADSGVKIMPAADPNMVSDTQKMLKIQGLQELMQTGMLNPQEVTKQILVYQGQDNIEQLMAVQPPPPNPEIQLKQQELQQKYDVENKKLILDAIRVQHESLERRSRATLFLAQAAAAGQSQNLASLEHELDVQSQRDDGIHAATQMFLDQLNQNSQNEMQKEQMKNDQQQQSAAPQ